MQKSKKKQLIPPPLTTNQPCKECKQVSTLPPLWMHVLPAQPWPERPGGVGESQPRRDHSLLSFAVGDLSPLTPEAGKRSLSLMQCLHFTLSTCCVPGQVGRWSVSTHSPALLLIFLWARQDWNSLRHFKNIFYHYKSKLQNRISYFECTQRPVMAHAQNPSTF